MVGLATSTLASSLEASLCPEDQKPGELSYRDEDLRSLWDIYHHGFRSYWGAEEPVWFYAPLSEELTKLMPGLPSQTFVQNLNRYKSLDRALGEWFDEHCKIRLPSTLNVRGGEFFRERREDLLREITGVLKKGLPVLIHYDPGVLGSKSPEWIQFLVGFHVSSLVSLYEKDGERWFLLRNSWGKSCSIYSPEVRTRCDRGHVWLTADEIKNYVSSMAYYDY